MKRSMPLAAAIAAEVFEQQCGDALAVVSVVDHEGRVGVVAARPPLVARPSEQLVVRFDDEGGPVDEVNVGEVLEFTSTERRLGREVAAVLALVGLAGVEGAEARRIGRGDRPDRHRLAVAEDGVRRPRGGVPHGRRVGKPSSAEP